MKKIGYLFLMVIGLCCGGCNYPALSEDDLPATLELSRASFSAVSYASEYGFTVTSNKTWKAVVSSGSEWCTISPASGKGNETTTITITVAAKTSEGDRSATIIVSAGELTRDVIVTQADLTLDKTYISATPIAATYTIAVTSGRTWTATSDATWCRVNPTSSEGNRTITVSVADGTSARSATITVAAGASSKVVTVAQVAPTLAVDKTSISANSGVGTNYNTIQNFHIGVTSNANWTAISSSTWCTLTRESGGVQVTVSPNTSSSSRTATVTISVGTLTKTVTVTQARS
jgi:hypothetical protein